MGRYSIRGIAAAVTVAVALWNGAVCAETVDRIVAVVGDDIVLFSEFKRFFPEQKRSRIDQLPRNEQEKMLDGLIERRLIETKARGLGIAVTDREVQDEEEAVKKANNLTTEMLVEALVREGLSIEDYRATVRSQILKAKLINREIRPQIVVTDELLRDYYTKDILGEHQMLVDFDVMTFHDDPKGELKDDIGDYYKAARSGRKTFEEVSKSASKQYRVELGQPRGIAFGSLSPELQKAITELKEGEVGELVRSKDVFQIFRLVARRAGGLKPFEDIRDDLKKSYLRDKLDKGYADWIEKLRKETFVEKRL